MTCTVVAMVASLSPAVAQIISPPPMDWQSTVTRDHALAGKIFEFPQAGGSAKTIDPASFVDVLSRATVVQLGEIHDNADHHRWQAWIITALQAAKRPAPAEGVPQLGIVFEQIRSDQQDGLDRFADFDKNARRVGTLHNLKRFLQWDKSGWSADGYDPLLALAVSGTPIYPGDVPRDVIKMVAKEGEGVLPADERARLKLAVPLGAKLDDASLTEIEESHCGMMPKSAFSGMAFAQRYRDASLADALLKAADRHGAAVLIAGNGHVRTDRGVPWYIRQRAPDKKVISVMLIEVEDGKTDPEAYVPRDPDGKPATDYIVFTPRAERPDPCEAFRKPKADKTPVAP